MLRRAENFGDHLNHSYLQIDCMFVAAAVEFHQLFGIYMAAAGYYSTGYQEWMYYSDMVPSTDHPQFPVSFGTNLELNCSSAESLRSSIFSDCLPSTKTLSDDVAAWNINRSFRHRRVLILGFGLEMT
ncbi:hypothetical protein CHS0354_027230, partial [Potamilus streckersoni]